MTKRTPLAAGAAAGLVAVLMGTFGAHVLDPDLPAAARQVFETGVRYHMYHALAIMVVACLDSRRVPGIAVGLFLAGIVFFSGSLYLLAVTGARWLGMIAPIGGTAFMAGWVVLIWTAVRRRRGHA